MTKEQNETGKRLLTGQFIGLKFEEGWLFAHVLETEFIELKPWIVLNENDNRDVIGAQTSGSEDDEVKDALDRRQLMPNDSEQNLIFQIRYGVAPSRMQVFPIFGRDRAPNLTGTSEPGEPQVPVTGYDSPYNEPSEQTEQFIVNGQDFPSFQAYNPMDEAKEARVSFHVNKLKFAVVEDTGLKKAMLQGQQPAKLHPVGLGAQRRDQVSTPAWLNDNFGEEIESTQQILSHGEDDSSNGNGQTVPGRFDE